MKLYLSSLGVPNTVELLRQLPKKAELSVAIIPNAWDVYSADRRVSEIAKTKDSFVAMGTRPQLVDITKLSGDALQAEIAKHDLLWVMGGNSFYLNYYVHESGLSVCIKALLNEGIVYGGESAGAVLACPTLHGVELLDDPALAPKLIWEGLGLIRDGIVPHWGLEKYADKLEQCKTEMEKYVNVITLSNDQALVVDGLSMRLVKAR